MGGMNLHLPITFTDGVKWLARIRRINATSPPPELQSRILKSEIATLRFLETVNIPTPRVYDCSVEGENGPAGVSYILMEFMPETVLDWSGISVEGKRKVIAQLADIYIELGKHRIPAMGCMDQIGTKHIGPLTRECLTDFTESSRITTWPIYTFTRLLPQLYLAPTRSYSSRRDIHRSPVGDVLDLQVPLRQSLGNLPQADRRGRGKRLLPNSCGRQRLPYPC
jgi:hypothetical protein